MLAAVKRAVLIVALALAAGSAAAADMTIARYRAGTAPLPFPRGERAQSVWASGACWTDCNAHCTWGLAACLTRDAQGQCLKLGDACDRYCQRECRTMGGPLVSDVFDAWE